MYEYDFETDILSDGNNQESTPTDALNYDNLYDAIYYGTYNAIDDYYKFHNIDNNSVDYSSCNDALQFATSTDAKLYTVSVANEPTSSAQATEAYLLDTRNILLIFACTWLAITLYSKIKNLMINYTKD